MHAIGIILLIAAVLVIASLLFVVWLVWQIVRLLMAGTRKIASALLPRPRPPAPPTWEMPIAQATRRCPRERCHVENAPGARYCRRCGCALSSDGPGWHANWPGRRPPGFIAAGQRRL